MMVDPVKTIYGGKVSYLPAATGLPPTTDTILLAASIEAGSNDTILEAGCGSGVASLCLASRCHECSIVGLELNERVAREAAENIALNDVGHRVSVRTGDVNEFRHAQKPFSFVMTNPPWHPPGSSRAPGEKTREGAVVESIPLVAWIRACIRLLADRGTLVTLHRPERLGDILRALDGTAGAIDLFPLWPRNDGSPAKRVLVRAVKGSKQPSRLLSGLTLHTQTGDYTDQANEILRGEKAIMWE